MPHSPTCPHGHLTPSAMMPPASVRALAPGMSPQLDHAPTARPRSFSRTPLPPDHASASPPWPRRCELARRPPAGVPRMRPVGHRHERARAHGHACRRERERARERACGHPDHACCSRSCEHPGARAPSSDLARRDSGTQHRPRDGYTLRSTHRRSGDGTMHERCWGTEGCGGGTAARGGKRWASPAHGGGGMAGSCWAQVAWKEVYPYEPTYRQCVSAREGCQGVGAKKDVKS